MASFNQVMLVGNLTADVKLSYTPSQTAVADTGLAVNEEWTGQDGQKHKDVLFIDVRAFGKLAEVMSKYLNKGAPVLVVGKLKLDRWTDREGKQQSRHRIIADRVVFLPRSGPAG